MTDSDDELRALRKTFYEEAEERLVELEELLLELEQNPEDVDLLNTIFRAVHSIKGGGAACELVEVATFAHAYESLLAPLRKGILVVNARLLDVLLFSTDVLGALLRSEKRGSIEDERENVQRAIESIRLELATVPPADQPSVPPARQVDLSAGLVLFDDEPSDPKADLPAAQRSTPPTGRSIKPPPSLASLLAPRPSQLPPGFPPIPPARGLTPSEWSLRASIPHDELSAASVLAAPRSAPPGTAAARAVGTTAPSPPPTQSAPPAARTSALPDDAVEVPDAQLQELVERAVGIAASSARISHGTADFVALQPALVRELLTELADQVTELEARLTALRGAGHSSQLVDGVVVRSHGEVYVLRIAQIESYFRPDRAKLKSVPLRGDVLLTDSGLLPVLRLAELLGGVVVGSDLDLSVAVIVLIEGRRVALLVDQVLTQGKLLVKSLETNFRKIEGIDGAAPYGSKLALVLDLAALARREKPRVKQSKSGTNGAASEYR